MWESVCEREEQIDIGLDLDLDGDMSDYLGARSTHSTQGRVMADQVPQLSQ